MATKHRDYFQGNRVNLDFHISVAWVYGICTTILRVESIVFREILHPQAKETAH